MRLSFDFLTIALLYSLLCVDESFDICDIDRTQTSNQGVMDLDFIL